jgi:hypothetical protein
MNSSTKVVTASLILLVIALVISGCMSSSKVNASGHLSETQQSTAAPTTQYTTEQSVVVPSIQYSSNQTPFIHIDPIQDIYWESGPAILNISGTTNFPVNSLFWVDIIEEGKSPSSLLNKIVIPAEIGKNGLNTFTYTHDMQDSPPGTYRVEIRKANQNFTATTHFNFALPGLWIQVDPIGETREGENLNVTGTTNLPAGENISVTSQLFPHSCPTQTGPKPRDTGGRRSECNGDCSFAPFETTVAVMPGPGGKNIWACSINTTEWCKYEFYRITTEASNGTNLTRWDPPFFRFGGEPPAVQ